MSCRFPGASDPGEFWKILVNAEPQFATVPENRWDHSVWYRPGEFRQPHSAYTDQVAFLEDVDRFAPAHYGIPPRRARTMDPQAKLFTDLAREALQDSGWEREGFDRASTGVFAGVTSLDHRDISFSRVTANLLADGSMHEGVSDPELLAELHEASNSSVMPFSSFTIPGALANMVPATVSEILDLGGPSLSVDAACSSALVALDTAIRSLRSGACSIAVVGGVYLGLSPSGMVGFSRAGALSRDGVCRPFDERADGFVLGEGGATLVLRPLDDALAAGDRIYAVIAGVGMANDGRGGGPMTPQTQGQLASLRAAYQDAGVVPGDIDLLEAHGTGTPVGDRTEVEALQLLRAGEEQVRPCYVSSSKALIGHTLSGAGAAGLVKAALAIHHGVVPPQPEEVRVSSELALETAELRLTTRQQPWPHDEVRRAGVSSFGFGGTNVHAVLESAPPGHTRGPVTGGERAVRQSTEESQDRPWLFLLSAGSVRQLARHAEEIHRYVTDNPDARPVAVARTLASRTLLTARLAVVAASREELLSRLELAARHLAEGRVGALADGVHAAAEPLPPQDRKMAFAFPGQGSQRPGMLTELVRRFPLLAGTAAELAGSTAEASAELAQELPDLLWGRHQDDDEAQAVMTLTDRCQPALGISGMSIMEMLAACGVRPDISVGHSVGEFAAGAAAGVLDPRDAVPFLARRGSALAETVAPGESAMLAVQAPIAQAEELATAVEGVWPACYNHEGQLVLSGSSQAVDALREHCAQQDVASARLEVSHAFHSPLVAAADEAMEQIVTELPLAAPTCTFVSSVSGRPCPEPQELEQLWARHHIEPVRFVDAVRSVAEAGARFLVQLHGGDNLLQMARRSDAGAGLDLLAVTDGRADGGRAFLTVLARLAVAGVPVEPSVLFHADAEPLLTLPPSPLDTEVYSVLTGTGRESKSARPSVPSDTATAAPSPATAPRQDAAPGPSAATSSPVPTHQLGETNMSGLVEFLHAQVALLQSVDPDGRALPTADPRRTAEVPAQQAAEAAAPGSGAAQLTAEGAADAAQEVEATVLSAIANVSAYSEDFLRAEHAFTTDLGFDSLMLGELTVRLRKQWPGIEISVAEIIDLADVGSLIGTVQNRLGAQRPAAAPAQRTATPPAPARQDAGEPARTAFDRRESADVRLFPEVVASQERARTIASASTHNPFFLQHEGNIRDTTRVGDRELISFSSYNYLGLSGHPQVAKAGKKAIERYGSSVSAARILSGNRPIHEELDRGLAELVGAQDALTLVSGHATNVTVIGHLMSPEDLILHDSLAHDSILQGCRQSGAARQPFPHNDVAALDRILTEVRDRYRRVLIVVEGVYSMDGDTADVPALITVKEKHGALLMIDEAHSIGVMGKTGGGMAEFSGVNPEDVDVWMGTLSKSLASCGGYIAGRRELIEHFRYTLPGFVFSAGLPPASTAAAVEALRLIRKEPERIARLHDNAEMFRRLAAEAGVDVGTSENTPIVPAITGDSLKALQLADRLYARGVSANPILHPAVEERLTRLRFFITSEHTEQQIVTTVELLTEELANLS
ncbi:aminotransferase class I/II-fold pyridoxal phosphate-dependent enzyme [Streptomyces bathyalis]|uniref:Aminotransferase class I/II-fold pyridoxal phosphate-dependent enzyme n=2 Tax=Streptomyces bathyalis TaxID=2710756 RepID=A0A7T1TDH5_9ACTN|nr:aminotransferase class I/II-fold pyridoxal phosphate-dependent enzyme [Streptomyces bathyalis]